MKFFKEGAVIVLALFGICTMLALCCVAFMWVLSFTAFLVGLFPLPP